HYGKTETPRKKLRSPEHQSGLTVSLTLSVKPSECHDGLVRIIVGNGR
ncbi:14964_t:CDS:1, partial [Racocetra persica]